MKSRFIFLTATLAVLLSTLLIAPAASAQNASRATIPFAFSANDHVLPAGCYEIKLESDSFLRLVSCDTGKMATVLVRTSLSNRPIAQGSLLFKLAGERYRLTQVRFSNADLESELAVQPKRQREIGRTENSASTEVAMK